MTGKALDERISSIERSLNNKNGSINRNRNNNNGAPTKAERRPIV